MMKFLLYIGILLVLVGCEDRQGRASAADLQAAAEAGRTAAEQAMALPEGSMEREGAVLHIRAVESALREHGYDECADTFARKAEQVLFNL